MVQVRQKLHNHAETVIRTFTNAFTVTSYFSCRAMASTITERPKQLIEVVDIIGPPTYSDLAFRLRLNAGE